MTNKQVILDFETYFDPQYSLTKLTTTQYVRDLRFKIWGVGIKHVEINDYMGVLEEETELRNPILLGWDEDDSLYIASTVDTEECLWMIDIAKKIIETRPPDVINNNE